MADSTNNLRSSTIRGIKWSFLTSLLTKLIPPATTIILARILVPDDFGLYGISLVIVNFLAMFLDAGLGKALIQRSDNIEKAKSVAFYNNLLLSVICYMVIYSLCPYAGSYFHRTEVTSILRITGLAFLIFPFLYIQRNILSRELKFKKLFYLSLTPGLVSGLLSICLAYIGMGVWALVYGYLLGLVLTTILSWRLVSWRPRWEYDFKVAKEMMAFGGYATLEVILGWIISTVDNIFVGRFLGAPILGIYRTGYSLAILPSNLVTSPMSMTLYPAFCRMHSDREALKKYYLKSLDLLSLFSFPSGILLFFTAPYFVPLCLGDKWLDAIPIIQLISIMGSLSCLVAMNPEVYRAIGRPDIIAKFFMVRAAFSLPTYYYAAQHGIIYLCVSHIALSALFVPINLYICSKVLCWNWIELFSQSKITIGISCLLITIGSLYEHLFSKQPILQSNLFINLILLVLMFLITTCLFMFLFDRHKTNELKLLLLESFGRI
jgi:teichuronic acid exporter